MKDIVTLIIAVIGAVLGVVNFIIARSKDKVKLKVFPKLNCFLENDKKESSKTIAVSRLCIEIVNLSDFPVSVQDAGFITNMYMGNGKLSFLDKKIAQENGTLPKRMDPRTSIVVYHPSPNMFADSLEKITGAYAVTQCGLEFKGKNKALSKWVKTNNDNIDVS